MRTHRPRTHHLHDQAGFSMIEMLMTAFIMAIGILGLSMLQVMSIKASRGGRSLATAVLVSEHVMDRVELEGRLSWLNATGDSQTPTNADFVTPLRYVTLAGAPASVVDTFNSKGGPPNSASTDPAEQTTFYTVTTTRADLVAANAPTTNGAVSTFTVQVKFADQVDQSSAPKTIDRYVTLTRRITHG